MTIQQQKKPIRILNEVWFRAEYKDRQGLMEEEIKIVEESAK